MLGRERLQKIGATGLIAGGLLTSLTACDKTETVVDVSASAFPKTLPGSVKKVEESAVRIDVEGEGHSNFSGVRVAEKLIFSVAHGWRKDNNKIRSRSTCPGTTEIKGVVGNENFYTTTESIYSTTKKQDLALLKTKDFITASPTASIARFSPTVGANLYFITYQDAKTGEPRNPVLIPPRSSNHPAEFAGVVLGEESGDLVVAIRKNYGEISETGLNKGGSGAPVFTEEGKLAGVALATYEKEKDTSVKALEDSLDIDITGASPNTRLNIAIVQPINRGVFNDFRTELEENPDKCVA